MYVGPNHWTSTRVHACSSSLLLLRLIRGSCHLPDGLFGVGKAEWGIKSDVESEGGRFSPCFGQTVAAGGGAGGQCESNCGIRLESSNLKCAHYDESGRGLDVTSGGTVDCVPPPPVLRTFKFSPRSDVPFYYFWRGHHRARKDVARQRRPSRETMHSIR